MMLLLLDDDDTFRTALGELLHDDGHAVRTYRSTAELPPLRELPPLAAMVTDYQLDGGEDGLSFAQRFHAAHPEVPVILVTAFATGYVTQAVAALPYVSLLRKPLLYDDLHSLVHAHRGSSKE